MKDSDVISKEIREFIENNMTVFDDDIELLDDTNIFKNGLVNSLFSMRLLCFIEDKFSISIPDEYIERENFVSINKMLELVNKVRG
ncbi:acyl carrier protein [Xenorhabdus bovienii]|uniref:Putative acyl carrier protein potentially involved in xenocoumacin synthesis n=1 Tax=Xenorhabdus bovienii TaxID=40576 RepID=A0A0B6X3D7_XENBV|nr:acyl carrier protein [Xenorhabdus bovienii]CDM88085.1 Putative acyl carrier protein potentially involved in xenocoumacin synthesis [Xenorhabdus bovienii]